MVLGVLAEHSLSFTIAPVIVELAQNLAIDKVALERMKLSTTVASYKMVHGLVRTFSKRTFSNLSWFPFFFYLDESTSNSNKKVLSMLVSYYHDDMRKVVVEHLGSLEVIKVNAVSLERALCNFFNDNIPWKILVMYLKEICQYLNIPASNPQRFVSHRWLSTYVSI
ncbi:uncharacterized protein LOC115203766 isoform X2 [Salmo trutta]|uniref:uncharacterized protein LOC115203766 isoform X2 n=1 Tax=Salmo trutta TaxID=8032 RepID=UPI0011325382|nr:uncharacterized protein LOC115203766 isoform X2 [Salmo trutta]